MIEQLVSILPKKTLDLTLKTWKSLKTFGLSQMMYSTAVYNNKCYIFAGRIYPGSNSRRSSYVFDGVSATPIADFPITVLNHRSIVVGDRILIFGGIRALAASSENMDMYWYDPATNTYTKDGVIPVRMNSCAAAKLGDYVYVYGSDVSSTGQVSGDPKLFYRYDLVAKTWEKLPYHSGPNVFSCNLLPYEGKLYTTGGIVDSGASIYDNTIRVYNPATGLWSIETPSNAGPGPRSTGGEIIESGIYLYGGRVSGSTTTKECWYYNFLDKLWYPCKPALSDTAYGDIILMNERIFTLDGWVSSSAGTVSGLFELS